MSRPGLLRPPTHGPVLPVPAPGRVLDSFRVLELHAALKPQIAVHRQDAEAFYRGVSRPVLRARHLASRQSYFPFK